ncbi:pimeloyl-ACP methyl ester esterase BioH [Aestuariibacter sp. AA17]|uniref:Pimeloyl-[acyl-carrier protein] methyl ester esterase n=1 Tax=Fluctibacter corallii TaxID=2984329 RepID=A0ABT3AAX9_9ALTE|nr:pimeloyl-ACP methyl ester esterase BioH [Aestuariibacter sp. AA17]MCV2885828.1 pimeloyl-ACP methyl ester esterase BioH [Aestuariibacter sp. AA17]
MKTSTLFTETRGNGPDLVMLHGWGVNSGVWQPISHLLQDHFRVTYIDLPGFGRNAHYPIMPYTLNNLSTVVSAYIPSRARVLGWSMGGLLAQHIALTRQDLAGLITVASTPKFVSEGSWPGIKPAVLSMFEKQLKGDFTKTLDRFLAIQALGSASAKNDIKTIQHHVEQLPMPSEVALHNGLVILSETDLREKMQTISIPMLQIFGKLDSLVPKAAIELMQHNQNVTQHIIDHASHGPFISHPEAFIDGLLNWHQGL